MPAESVEDRFPKISGPLCKLMIDKYSKAPLIELLHDVYSQFPEFKVQSRISGDVFPTGRIISRHQVFFLNH